MNFTPNAKFDKGGNKFFKIDLILSYRLYPVSNAVPNLEKQGLHRKFF